MKRKLFGIVVFFIVLMALMLAATEMRADTFGIAPTPGAGVTPTPTPYKHYMPYVSKNAGRLTPDPAPGDWRWVVIAGDWGQDEQAAKDWALEHLTGHEWQTAYWPVYPCPEPPEPCPLYYRLIIGRWDSKAEAEEWAALQLPGDWDWEVYHMYSRWTEGWWWEYE